MRDLLNRELAVRRERNPRYSLRAFARSLAIDHSALSQILRGRRRLTIRTIRALGSRLRLSPEKIAGCCADAHDAAVLSAIRRSSFRPSSRWIASVANIPLDDVNVSLQRLIYNGVLVMAAPKEWRIR